jgi:hypothetical protein
MTEQLVLDLLVSLGVVRIGRDETSRKYLVHFIREGNAEVCTVTDYKHEHQEAIAELEEEKQEVQQNHFTPPLSGEIGMGATAPMRVQYWKKDEQLTPEEQQEKERRLAQIGKELQFRHRVIDAMNYIQVHYHEIAHKLVPAAGAAGARSATGVKEVWNKGLKPAALFCLKQFPEAVRQGRTELDVCREFLARYEFAGESQHTAEQLLNAAVQIRLLDRVD